LEAQRHAVQQYLNRDTWSLIGDFTEVESGKRNERPELVKALAACKRNKAKPAIWRSSRRLWTRVSSSSPTLAQFAELVRPSRRHEPLKSEESSRCGPRPEGVPALTGGAGFWRQSPRLKRPHSWAERGFPTQPHLVPTRDWGVVVDFGEHPHHKPIRFGAAR
jgi:hypothetical protein